MSESIPEFVEIQRLQEDLAFCKTELAERQKYILELERELAEARKDTERINILRDLLVTREVIHFEQKPTCVQITGPRLIVIFDTLRQAIDKAKEQGK